LDNSATGRVDSEVKNEIIEKMTSIYGNPSSLHKMGNLAEREIKQAKRIIGEYLNVSEREIYFTSGGTESNNLAIFGTANRSQKKGNIVTTTIEHPSVLHSIEELGRQGYEIRWVSVDDDGLIDINELYACIDDETILVSVMHVNNEMGSIQPIQKIGECIFKYNKEHAKQIVFHVDAVQSYGKIHFSIKNAHIDLLSFSAHKIHGLKGTGGLYIKQGTPIKALFYGGSQEQSIRPGTENLLGIISLCKASQIAYDNLHANHVKMKQLRIMMIEALKSVPGIKINTAYAHEQSPYILSVSFKGVRGEVLIHSLEMDEIYVSTGSACSSKKKVRSHVLTSMKLTDEESEGTIRISFGKYNTETEVAYAAEKIIQAVKMQRRITKWKE